MANGARVRPGGDAPSPSRLDHRGKLRNRILAAPLHAAFLLLGCSSTNDTTGARLDTSAYRTHNLHVFASVLRLRLDLFAHLCFPYPMVRSGACACGQIDFGKRFLSSNYAHWPWLELRSMLRCPIRPALWPLGWHLRLQRTLRVHLCPRRPPTPIRTQTPISSYPC